jgi:hypothetical protein
MKTPHAAFVLVFIAGLAAACRHIKPEESALSELNRERS